MMTARAKTRVITMNFDFNLSFASLSSGYSNCGVPSMQSSIYLFVLSDYV